MIILIILMSFIAGCSSGTNVLPEVLPYKLIYVTKDSFNGNFYPTATLFGYNGSHFDTDAVADYLCQVDSQCPNGKTCKAMLAIHGWNRPGSIIRSANPLINWVLAPNTNYKNLSGRVIGKTNENAIFDVAGTQPITLANVINPNIDNAWSGMRLDWTSSAECNGWTTEIHDEKGFVGSPNQIHGEVIAVGMQTCDNILPIYCVEQ